MAGEIFPVLAALFYALGGIAEKLGVIIVNPILASFIRVFFSVIFLWLIIILRKEPLLSKKQNLKLVFISFLFGLGTISYFAGLKYAGLAVGSTFAQFDIIFSPILAFLFLKEKRSPGLIFGIFLAFLGILIITFGQNKLPIESTWQIGILFAVLGAALYSVEQNLLKKIIFNEKVSAMAVATLERTYSLLIFLIFLPFFPWQFSFESFSILGISGFFVALGALCLFIAIARFNLSKVIPILALRVVLATIFAFLIFQEPINLITLIGIVTIILSFILISYNHGVLGDNSKKTSKKF